MWTLRNDTQAWPLHVCCGICTSSSTQESMWVHTRTPYTHKWKGGNKEEWREVGRQVETRKQCACPLASPKALVKARKQHAHMGSSSTMHVVTLSVEGGSRGLWNVECTSYPSTSAFRLWTLFCRYLHTHGMICFQLVKFETDEIAFDKNFTW